MNNNYQADAVDSIPELSALTSQGYPTNGSPELGIPATQPGAAWFYSVNEEIRNAIMAGGQTPDATKVNQLALAMTGVMPTGAIIPFAGASIPDKFLLCNGSAVSRTEYANLFAVIGTAFGAGDGSSTFTLPDLRDRVIQGASATHALAQYIEAGLPNIIADNMYIAHSQGSLGTGAWSATNTKYSNVTQSSINAGWYEGNLTFNASSSSSVFGNSNTVQPKSLHLNYVIKA